MIDPAIKEENDDIINDINELTYLILSDMELPLVQQNSKDDMLNFLKAIYLEEDTRLSYQNIIVKKDKNKVVGIAIVYPGDQEETLDKNLQKHVANHFPTASFSIQMESFPGEFYIDSIAVVESFRRKGIGGELIRSIFKMAKERGYKKVSLNVDLENTKAQHLYERNGFQLATEINLYGRYYSHMIKEI